MDDGLWTMNDAVDIETFIFDINRVSGGRCDEIMFRRRALCSDAYNFLA